MRAGSTEHANGSARAPRRGGASCLAKGLFFALAAPLACALSALILVVAVQAATGQPLAPEGLAMVDELASSYGFELALDPSETPLPAPQSTFTPAPPTATAFQPNPYTSTPSPTATYTPTATSTASDTPSATPTETWTPSATDTPSATVSPSGTGTVPAPATASPTRTRIAPSPTRTASRTATRTRTPVPPTATSPPSSTLPPTETAGPGTEWPTATPVAATATSSPLPASATPTPGCVSNGNSGFESTMLGLINQERQNEGLSAYASQSQLRAAARLHSADMACNGFVSHTGSDGSTVRDRVAAQGYAWSWIGENIYCTSDTSSSAPQRVFDWWMNSAPHHANLMSPNYTQIGLGYIFANGRGCFTADFARPG